MSSITFLFIFVVVIATLFLVLNFILAPHNPYQEKYSIFECGFHSFLGQNRAQFGVKFFIFALVYLLLDLEILVIYPYGLSSYENGLYGLIMVVLFICIITVGFVFELGKNALKIDSRQSYKYFHKKKSFVHLTSTKSLTTSTSNVLSSQDVVRGTRSFHATPVRRTEPVTFSMIIMALAEQLASLSNDIGFTNLQMEVHEVDAVKDTVTGVIDIYTDVPADHQARVRRAIRVMDAQIEQTESNILRLLREARIREQAIRAAHEINNPDVPFPSAVDEKWRRLEEIRSQYRMRIRE